MTKTMTTTMGEFYERFSEPDWVHMATESGKEIEKGK